MAKAIHLFMNMDKMIGGQFEQGLAQMKSVVEAASNKSEMTLNRLSRWQRDNRNPPSKLIFTKVKG